MNKLNAWLVTVAGIILILPLIGVTQLGTLTDGLLAWLLAIVVLAIGITQIIRSR